MSRFRSPRKWNADNEPSATPEHYDRSPLTLARLDSPNYYDYAATVGRDSIRHLFDDSLDKAEEEEEPRTPSSGVFNSQSVLPTKTPYAMLKRLAAMSRVAENVSRDDLPEILPQADSASFVSHTSKSIQETSAFLGQAESPSTRHLQSPLPLQTQLSNESKDDAEYPSRTSSPLITTPSKTVQYSRLDSIASRHSSEIPNTPSSPATRPRSREVANGYISPPQSRRTSPQNISTEYWTRPSVPPMFRKISSPISTSIASAAQVSTTTTSSPRSRLTRTLIEIQKELAVSREGLEDIETRLSVLETHSSVSPDQITKHVQDCIQNLMVEAEDSFETTMDPFVDSLIGEESMAELLQTSVLEEEATPTPWRKSFILRALVVGCVGILAAEYTSLFLLNELGRRHPLFVT